MKCLSSLVCYCVSSTVWVFSLGLGPFFEGGLFRRIHVATCIFSQAEVPVPRGAGLPDDFPGPDHALLPQAAGRGPAVPGLLCRRLRRAAQNPPLHPACFQGTQ